MHNRPRFFRQYSFEIQRHNQNNDRRAKAAEKFGYVRDEKRDGDVDDKYAKRSYSGNPYIRCEISLKGNGYYTEGLNYYESLEILEEIRCIEFKESIYKNIGYIDDKKKVDQILKDVGKTFYSVALSDIMEAIDKIFKEQQRVERNKNKNGK